MMKRTQPTSEDSKSPREKFVEIGTKLMSVSKAEIEARDAEWRKAKRRIKGR